MGDATIITSVWRQVELGRVVLFNNGPYEGKLAAVVEIVDMKRVLLDNPNDSSTVPRHASSLKDVTLTHLVIPKIARGAGSTAVRKQWQAAEIDKKWNDSQWSKTREASRKRRELSDFDRYKAMRQRKVQRLGVRKQLATIRKTAKA